MNIIVNLYDVLLFPLILILILKTGKQMEEISIPLLLINFQNIQKGEAIIPCTLGTVVSPTGNFTHIYT